MNDGRNSFKLAALAVLMLGGWAPLAAANPGCTECTEPNGRGIYVAKGNSYCIKYNPNGEEQFCPEGFVQTASPGGTLVELKGRLVNAKGEDSEQGFKVGAVLKGQPMRVLGVSTRASVLGRPAARLIFAIAPENGAPVTVTGSALSDLTLRIRINPPPMQTWALPRVIDFRFEEVGVPKTPDSLYEYKGTWSLPNNNGVTGLLCDGPVNPKNLSVLPDKRVDGMQGTVTDEGRRVTVACGSGAIVTCMNWGYQPSRLSAPSPEENALLGACIQAKRGAYLGGAESYTEQGVQIALRDNYSDAQGHGPINNAAITALEAIWTHKGAACLNPDQMRSPKVHQNLKMTGLPLPPTCPKNIADWWKLGRLATGKALSPGP